MKIIELKSISKSFKLKHENNSLKNKKNEEFYSLKDISFNVNKGEALGIIGENGSGKTTLLRIIAGILKPTSGKVNVKGKIMSFIELGAGLQPELTGRENIFLYGSLLGIPKEEIKSKLNQIIEFSGLKKFIDAKFRTYSTGMQMRLVFSTAMMNNPDVLLIDEIIAVGDEFFQKKSFNRIKQLKEQGKTIIFVSHSMEQVKKICDKVIFLDHGKIRIIGSPEKVIPIYLEKFYKLDDKSMFKKINERINKISKLEKEQKKIIDSISKTPKNIFNKFKIKTLKNNLEINKREINGLKFSLSHLFESYKYLLEANLDSAKHKLEYAYNKNNEKLIKKIENQKYEILEDFKKILIFKAKFCDKSEKNEITQTLKTLMREQLYFIKGTREINVLKELKELLEREIKEIKNKKIKKKLSGELESIIIKLFGLKGKDNYGMITTYKSTKRKKFDNEKLGILIDTLRKNFIYINNNLFNLQLEKQNYLMSKNKDKAKECEKEITHLKQKRKRLIDEINAKEEIINVKRKNSNVKIISVKFLNLKSNETKSFKPGDKFTIEITYNAFKRINNPVFGVGIFKDDCTHITGPNTKFHNFNIDFIKGKGKVYYTIDSLPLLEGDYLVTVAIHPYNSFIPYDVHTRLYSFKVIKNHIHDFGTLYIKAKWEIKKN